MEVGLGICSPASPAMSIGPVETAIGLSALGTEVTVFAEAGMASCEGARGAVDRIVSLPLPVRDLPPRVRDSLFLPTRLGLARRWASALRERPVDVVHAFSPGAASLLPPRIPVVVQAWYHPARRTLLRRLRREAGYGTGSVGRSLPAPLRPAAQAAAHAALQVQGHTSDLLGYRRADLLATSTPSAARFFSERGQRAECIPPCTVAAATVEPRAPGDSFRVTFCAHPLDRPWKGLRYLLEALTITRRGGPLEINLAGGWAERPDRLLAAVERAGVQVNELGKIERKAYLAHLASRTDLLVAPALWEEWGYSTFEGLTRGVPVIAFDVYPYSETLGPGVGRLVHPRDVRALARAIDEARAGRLPSREKVLERARDRWGAEAVAGRLLHAYEGLRGRPKRFVRGVRGGVKAGARL